MKQLFSVYSVVLSCTVFAILGCGKNSAPPEVPIVPLDTFDYSNIYLKDKPVVTIQKAVSGRWQLVRDEVFGWAGWDTIYPQHDRFVSFLKNDTLKVEYNGAVTLYEKGSYIWRRSPGAGDSVFIFTINGKVNWIMDKIYKDTLKIDLWPDLMFLKRIN